jgi:hypothetical protein
MPRFLVAGRDGVWALDQADGTVTDVDPRTDRTSTADDGMHGSGGDLAASAKWLWARGSERLLVRVDPRSRQVVERYGPDAGNGSGGGRLRRGVVLRAGPRHAVAPPARPGDGGVARDLTASPHPRTVRHDRHVIRRISSEIARPMSGSAISTPSATTAALATTPRLT